MDIKRALGARIRTLRDLKGMTQDELAAATRTSTDTISSVERGINWPSVPTLEALAHALDTTIIALFDDLGRSGDNAPRDLVAVARDLLRQLGRRDLEVAVAMLQTMVDNAPKRKPATKAG